MLNYVIIVDIWTKALERQEVLHQCRHVIMWLSVSQLEEIRYSSSATLFDVRPDQNTVCPTMSKKTWTHQGGKDPSDGASARWGAFYLDQKKHV